MILKNGAMVATVWAESIPYWATASNVVILSLNKGDQVYMHVHVKNNFQEKFTNCQLFTGYVEIGSYKCDITHTYIFKHKYHFCC